MSLQCTRLPAGTRNSWLWGKYVRYSRRNAGIGHSSGFYSVEGCFNINWGMKHILWSRFDAKLVRSRNHVGYTQGLKCGRLLAEMYSSHRIRSNRKRTKRCYSFSLQDPIMAKPPKSGSNWSSSLANTWSTVRRGAEAAAGAAQKATASAKATLDSEQGQRAMSAAQRAANQTIEAGKRASAQVS